MIVATLQECHDRAWNSVGDFLEAKLTMFNGKMMDAEPVLMPAVSSWIRKTKEEYSNCPEDFAVMMIMNCPTAGILTGLQKSFIQNFVTNVIADWPLNACCLLVHPNRAGQSEGRSGVKKLVASTKELAKIF